MQVLQEQKPAPESTGAGVFPVGASRNQFIERFHESGEVAKPFHFLYQGLALKSVPFDSDPIDL